MRNEGGKLRERESRRGAVRRRKRGGNVEETRRKRGGNEAGAIDSKIAEGIKSKSATSEEREISGGGGESGRQRARDSGLEAGQFSRTRWCSGGGPAIQRHSARDGDRLRLASQVGARRSSSRSPVAGWGGAVGMRLGEVRTTARGGGGGAVCEGQVGQGQGPGPGPEVVAVRRRGGV
jgi:hypothetical protein